MKKVLLPALVVLLACGSWLNAFAAQPAPQDLLKADRLYAAGKFSEALSLYLGLLSEPSGQAAAGNVHSRIGDCYFQLGDYPNALQAYRRALQSEKPLLRPATQYWIGFCSLLLGRNSDAVAEFMKIPELYPDSGMWVSTAYYWAGRASERAGMKEQAAAYYRKAGGKGVTAQERFAMGRAEAVGNPGTKAQASNNK